jgi:hypothetical protein
VRSLVAAAAPALCCLVLVPFFTFRDYADVSLQTFDVHRQSNAMRHDGRLFWYGRRDAVEAVDQLLVRVDELARPGDRLIVGPGTLQRTPYSEAYLYYLLPDLVPGTRYIEMDPGVADAPDSGLADEVAAADVVILSSVRDDWNEPNDSVRLGSPEPDRVLARDFCEAGSFGRGLFGRGLFVLYVRCERLADAGG